MKILDVEVIDPNCDCDLDAEDIQPSDISVLVKFEHNDTEFFLDFQTTTTLDYGAYSPILDSYANNPDHIRLRKMFEDEHEFEEFICDVKEQSGAQNAWHDYVTENYILDDDHFGGMDANSKINKAIRRE